MLRRIPALIRPRPFSGLPLSSGNWDVSVAVCVPPTARSGTGRTENNIQRHFGTGSCIYSKKDSQSVPANEISQKTAETQGDREETQKKNLLDILKDMKVELSTVNVQTTKPRGKRPSAGLQAAVSRHRRAPEDPPKNRNEFLSSELVAAASAVADSLPWDKQTTKSELLRQLQQHEEETRTQKDREKSKISFRHIISEMKIARSPSARVSTRPQHQIQFDEEMDNSSLHLEKPSDFKQRKGLFKGKRLGIFDIKAFADEAPETEASPSLWEIEFAKQLATVNEQPLGNGFEEMIQWTKEGKLWEFPVNNEAGFDDDGSEFHDHIFLDKHLEGFPKQGPIRIFMELVTSGLSKNPYLSVKQKVDHIEWFRNYFNEKQDILKENKVEFT
ncbi:28S ribosomal protein S31, mitochondrial [Cricetulus griseus]|uniref:Small ribosomal subunit protein mS31 n=1 Tax=Cricetulus griseus TaxID=10029 RepID=A0A061IIF5_CRIGR|nr:28S ribosomal protein S31, mitochondrial [Cricetulus griseus]ERE88735.1 28S ribosomal protein S31 [Cricetulus griseus]